MSDDLKAINEALKTENDVIKGLLEQANARLVAHDQTLKEVLNGNICLKAGASLLERQIDQLKVEVETLKKEKQILSEQLSNQPSN